MSEALRDGLRWKLMAGFTLAAFLLAAACGGSLYKVKPIIEAPVVEGAMSRPVWGLSVRAVPLLTDEESFELFESNLLLAGLLPVRLEMMNINGYGIRGYDLKKARFRLRDAEGHEWKMLTSKQTAARILKANDVYLYNPNARAKFEEDLRAHAFDLVTQLKSKEQRRGLIFFQTPQKQPVASPRGLVLIIETSEQPQPLELRLN
jgi:hypothetical protein